MSRAFCYILHAMKILPTDIRVRDVVTSTQAYAYRTPLKFGGVPTTHATILDVRIRVESRDGRTTWGSGSMPLGQTWSFPSKKVPASETLRAMEILAGKIARWLPTTDTSAHPVELSHGFEPEFFRAAAETTRELNLAEPIPKLCALVVASPFDAALHDAYGKIHNRHVYDCYGPDWLNADLSRYLDEQFRGEFLDRYTLRQPKPRLPLYHLIGALDALTAADVKDRLNDGLPNTLGEWIVKDELTHLKIKLNGNDAAWDIDRVLAIDRVAGEAQAKRGCTNWVYSLDFNEQCPNVEYLLEVLRAIDTKNPAAFQRAAYVEQPTARDLEAHPENKMHAAAKLKPVVIDESLIDYESLLLAREQGYTGVALKACKGQSQAIVMGAAAQKFGMFLCVQDLTCPGKSFLHSAGLAAHIGPVTAIEGNARQYCPAANEAWAREFPRVFTVRDGTIETGGLNRVGLGH
jgi:L-alanine-DL-glutamate epimerase-like enolase superfamily enzyme